MTFSKFNLENPRSRSWVRGKLKSQHGSNILSTHIPFIPCQSAIPFLIYDFFKIWPFLKIQGQSHGWDQSWKSQSGCYILSTHILFVPCQSALPFLRYSIFKIWPWKSKVKVMGEGIVESHNMGATFYRLTSLSFHVNWTSHTWDTAFSKFDLENPRSRSWVRWTLKVTTWVQHSIDSHPFNSMSICHPIPEIRLFQNLTLKIQIKVMGEGNVESHKVGVTYHRLTSLSFHVNRASHSRVMTFSKFDLENQGSRSWVRSQFKVTMWV